MAPRSYDECLDKAVEYFQDGMIEREQIQDYAKYIYVRDRRKDVKPACIILPDYDDTEQHKK